MSEPIASTTPAPIQSPPAGGGVPPTGVPPTPVGVLPPPSGNPAAAPPTPPQAPAVPPEVMQYIQQQQREMAGLQQTIRAMQGQMPQPSAAQPQANPLGVTPWDRGLEQYLTADDKGVISELPGAPPGTAARYMRHQQEKRQAVEALLNDPMKALGPLIQQQAELIARQQMAAQQDEQAGLAFTRDNADWLYTGQKVMDAQGGMTNQLSDAGMEFLQHVAWARQNNVQGAANLIRYATGMVSQSAMQRRQANQQFTPQQEILARKLGVLERQAAPAAGLPNTQPPAPGGGSNGQVNRGPQHTVTPLRARVAAAMAAGQHQ